MPSSAIWCLVFASVLSIGLATGADAPCHAELSRRSDVTGSYVPQCTDDGKFTPVQCHGSTGYCWCVSVYGVEVEGTRKGPGEGPIDCEKDLKDLASVRQKRSILSRLIPRPHPPGIPRPPPRPHPPPPPPRPRRPLDWF